MATSTASDAGYGLTRSKPVGPLEDRKVVSLGLHNQKDFYKPRFNDIDIETVRLHVMNGERQHDIIRSPRASDVTDPQRAELSPRPVTVKTVDKDVITGYVIGKPTNKEEQLKVG
jgi:hypothetical protein